MDGFPSGQRGQTVNLLQIASVVRIHLHPFESKDSEVLYTINIEKSIPILMGGGGFEPPKQVAADLQSVPFGHSGIYPNVMKTFYMYFRLTVKKYIISSNHTQDFFLLVLNFLL